MEEFEFFFVTLHPVKAINMEMTYKKRIADGLLQRKLAGKGAVLIEGAKWCGKTTGVDALNLLTEKIDPEKMKMPSFKMILIGVGTYAYRREDGIYVVPIGCLKD